jgi:hypothetical protein
MKTKILLPIVLLVIIVVLGSSLIHEIVQKHRVWRGAQQFQLVVFVQLYQNLDRGEADAAKQRLGALVTVESDYYEKQYGQETGTKFAPRLAEAKVIKTAFQAMSSPSK